MWSWNHLPDLETLSHLKDHVSMENNTHSGLSMVTAPWSNYGMHELMETSVSPININNNFLCIPFSLTVITLNWWVGGKKGENKIILEGDQ